MPVVRDRDKRDIKMTVDIRSKITEIEMTTNARRVTIIVQNGKVTLRGPVKTPDEKDNVYRIAREIAGEGNVNNQLEVES